MPQFQVNQAVDILGPACKQVLFEGWVVTAVGLRELTVRPPDLSKTERRIFPVERVRPHKEGSRAELRAG